MNRYAFFYLMNDAQQMIREAVPRHVAYWNGLGLPDYAGGPFADRSGGLITFSAPSQADAESIVAKDPFVIEGLIATQWLKQWVVE